MLYLWFLHQDISRVTMTSQPSQQHPKPAQQPHSSSGKPKSRLAMCFTQCTVINSTNRAPWIPVSMSWSLSTSSGPHSQGPRILQCLWQSRHGNAFLVPMETAAMLKAVQPNVLKCHRSMLRLSSQRECKIQMAEVSELDWPCIHRDNC